MMQIKPSNYKPNLFTWKVKAYLSLGRLLDIYWKVRCPLSLLTFPLVVFFAVIGDECDN